MATSSNTQGVPVHDYAPEYPYDGACFVPNIETDFTLNIQNSVSIINKLTEEAIRADDAHFDFFTAQNNLHKPENLFRKSLREIAVRSDPNGTKFELMKLEVELDEKAHARAKEVWNLNHLSDEALEALETVEKTQKEACTLACKGLAHAFVLCERAGMSEDEVLGGRFSMKIGLGGTDKPLKDVFFHYGGGVLIEGMTLSNARKLKAEMERRCQIVRVQLQYCRADLANLTTLNMSIHQDNMEEVDEYKYYMQEKDLDAWAKILKDLDEEVERTPRGCAGLAESCRVKCNAQAHRSQLSLGRLRTVMSLPGAS